MFDDELHTAGTQVAYAVEENDGVGECLKMYHIVKLGVRSLELNISILQTPNF